MLMDLEAFDCSVASMSPFSVMLLVVTMMCGWQCPISSRAVLCGMACL